jgi:hypothetical protein
MPYTVHLVRLFPFPNNDSQPGDPMPQADAIQRGVETALKELFRVLLGRDPRLRWYDATTMGAVRPGAGEVVVYFVDSFASGGGSVVRPQLEMLVTHGATPQVVTQARTAIASSTPQMGRSAPERGLMLAYSQSMISGGNAPEYAAMEVHVGDLIRNDFPHLLPRRPVIGQWTQRMIDTVGDVIGRTAFHEVIHAKLEPLDTHALGGVAAVATAGAVMTSRTVRLMQAAVRRDVRRSYLPGRALRPPAPRPQPRAPAGQGVGLQGLDGDALQNLGAP